MFIGVDVGTNSVRAAVFTENGNLLAQCVKNITIWKTLSKIDFCQQSSTEIWENVCFCVKECLVKGEIEPSSIKGIGFDATCSLVVLDEDDNPVCVSPDKEAHNNQNIIVWFDHRAQKQTEKINKLNNDVLKYVGGKINVEMQSPKILWLKEELPEQYKKATKFYDLADFLTYKATNDDSRSVCTTVCKWTYKANSQSWSDEYWNEIGLNDIVESNYEKIGNKIKLIGDPLGNGLTEESANELGLKPNTPVSTSLIDAHAGGLGILGGTINGEKIDEFNIQNRLALISGTSTCVMTVNKDPIFISGIWGPYFGAMIPNFWLNEGGQSATGALIDHVIESHPSFQKLKKKSDEEKCTIYETLNKLLQQFENKEEFGAMLTKNFHVLDYHLGNRSPISDPTLSGMVCGLGLSDSMFDLAIQYLATIQSISYGTRKILEEMNLKGYDLKHVFICGGLANNTVFLREQADITGCQIILPKQPDTSVLLGSAISASVASKFYPSIIEAMSHMSNISEVISPNSITKDYHDLKYKVYLELYQDQEKYKNIMSGI